MNRTKNGFPEMNLPDFIEILNNIVTKMKGNANFPDQQAAVTTLATAADEFMLLVAQAAKGSAADKLARDASRDAITVQLRNLGNAVTAVSEGDLIFLDSSGFAITKERQSTPPLVKPEAPKVTAGVNVGEIQCLAKKQAGSETVTYMLSTDPANDDNWKKFSTSKSKFLFSVLHSGQRYYIKYALVGVRNQETISDMVSYISQ